MMVHIATAKKRAQSDIILGVFASAALSAESSWAELGRFSIVHTNDWGIMCFAELNGVCPSKVGFYSTFCLLASPGDS